MKKQVAVGLLIAGLIYAFPALAAGALDGKTFAGQVGEKGQANAVADNFVFTNGKFASTLCSQFGYGEGVYKTTGAKDAVHFTAETTSQAGGKKDWQGTVKGEVIEGGATTVENGQTSQQWFKGTLKR